MPSDFCSFFQLFRITKWIVNKNIEWQIIAELILHLMITFIPIAVPLASLFATVYAMRKLSEDSELMVMRSFGLSKGQILRPFLILGSLISLLCYLLTSTIIPESKREFKKDLINNFRSGSSGYKTWPVFYTNSFRESFCWGSRKEWLCFKRYFH